jgi:hypothetical protein
MPITEAATPHSVTLSAAEIDLELFTFVERYVTTNFRWDLILLFGNHPDAELTAREISTTLRRGIFTTTKELDDLTYLRVLVRRYTPERTTYRLTKRAALRRSATRLAALDHPPPILHPA